MRVQGPQLFAAMGLTASVWACSATAPRQAELIVSAAISLKDPLQTLAKMYEQRYETRVHLNYGASGWLSSQIKRGAPVDVYASASEQYLKELEAQHLLAPGGPRPLAGNRLVLIVPRSSAFSLSKWSDLRSVRDLAVGNPMTVPAGAYAQECLRSLGLWDELRPRLVFAEHVRQVLDYVAHSEVEAGLVYATDTRIVPGAISVVAEAPAGTHAPIRYGIAVVKTTASPDAASRFVELATSPTGGMVLQSHGFSVPER